MTDNSDDMLLARLGEVGCQERTHIESHLTEHNRGLAETGVGKHTYVVFLHCYGEGENTTRVGRGGKKHTKRGEKHKKGEMKGD